MSPLHVACAADDRYAPHSAAMLHSVLDHRDGHDVSIHYLHGSSLSRGARRRLAEMAESNGGAISFLAIPDERVAGLPTMDYIPATMWYRILLPELLPAVDRILYLDVDTIAVDRIAPLWETDLGGHYIGAVTNVFQSDHRHRPAALGLANDRTSYFNSGVLLMNLELMRRDGCTAALHDFARARGAELVWPDQDTFNVVLGERRHALHPRWNFMNSFLVFPWSEEVFGAETLEEARRHPAIRHFEGPSINKPWHYLCERDMREVYFEHRRQTPWPSVSLEGVTARNILTRFGREMRRRVRRPSEPGPISA